MDLQIYQEVFELEFLRETEAVYRAESLRMIRDPEFTVSLAICVLHVHGKATYGVCKYLNVVLCVCVLQLPNYLSHVDRRLSQENNRLLHYLHQCTRYGVG